MINAVPQQKTAILNELRSEMAKETRKDDPRKGRLSMNEEMGENAEIDGERLSNYH